MDTVSETEEQELGPPKKTNPERSIIPALRELERAFIAFAPRVKREMPLPVITIQSKGRRNALAWFWKDRWQETGTASTKLPEINMCAEFLSRSRRETLVTLAHEMCHLANQLDGIRDCSANQYHNKHFLERCRSIGLSCEKMGPHGWARTTLEGSSADMIAAIDAVNIDEGAFAIFRPDNTNAQRPGSRMKRWTCGCSIIRAAVEIDMMCMRCNKPMHYSDKAVTR